MDIHYDVDGTALEIGDRIVLLVRQGAPAGAEGTIIAWHGDNFGVAFGLDFLAGHNLEGALPNNAKNGQWIQPNQARKIGAVVPADADENAVIEILRQDFANEKALALINGKYYALTPVEKGGVADFIQPLLHSTAKRIQEVQNKAKLDVIAERRRAENVLPMPEISREELSKGIRLYKSGNCYGFIAPFHYAPKFFGRDGEIPAYEISDEFQKKLATDCMFACEVDATGHVHKAYLMNTALSNTFSHYHGDGEDCLGTLMRPAILTLNDFLAFSQKYQKTLETINDAHMRNKYPKNLPSYADVRKSSHKLNVKKIWTTTPDAGKAIAIGSAVKVIACSSGQPVAYVGVIGKVRLVGGTMTQVDFLDDRNWNFNLTDLELMPLGTRRTRKPDTEAIVKEHNKRVRREPWLAPKKEVIFNG